MKKKIEDLEKNINLKFNNVELLKKSLIHKSFDNKNNNEKLEFLGDRVLGLVLSKTPSFSNGYRSNNFFDKTKPITRSPKNSSFSLLFF